ncbi:class I SAM-dependent DNA methyltransferase [Micromonospora sp. NPDC050397]|uniref:class I SAM-dependent DNA methyltransferase n=1 Tax=Micromonospora sp. NPDC050397 TaxID=3364279 RepID=UPI0038514CF8
MVDHQFADADLARLYDVFYPWEQRDDLAFYLPLVMSARSVLDIGCGTGMLLRQVREHGHQGRLCGLDPGHGMLERARERTDVEWLLGDLSSATWDREFDLAVMTGHAFQVLLSDEDLRAALLTIRSALTDGGRFAFETRNPSDRAWRYWTPEHGREVTVPTGAVVRMEHEVEQPVRDGFVTFTTTYTSPTWAGSRTSRSTLRFLDRDQLRAILVATGLVVEEQFGDWAGGPLTDTSPEIITIARRA